MTNQSCSSSALRARLERLLLLLLLEHTEPAE